MLLISSCSEPKTLLNSSDYHQLRSGIQNSRSVFERGQGRVAFLGGSITYNGGWRDSLMAFFRTRFPQTEFEFIGAGIPSMGSTPSAFRLERDVLSKGPVDLLFLEAAVNDATNGRSTNEQIRAMEGVIRHLKYSNPAIDMVMMHFVDPDKMKEYRDGRKPQVIMNHDKVADHYQIPTINLAKEVTDRIDHGEFSWEDDFKDLHPSPFGQGVYARSMIAFLENAYQGYKDSDPQIIYQPLPAKMDPWCYDHGRLIDVANAELSNGWAINPSWEPNDSTGTRANYSNVPMLISETAGSSLSFDFWGNAVGIAVAAGQDAGIIEFRVDKNNWQTLNLYTQWSSQLHLPWYYTLATGLSKGPHKLDIRVSPKKDQRSKGNACRIRYFFINQS